MKLEQVFQMKGGLGETSYAKNSSLQRAVISSVKPILEESVKEVYCSVFPECMRIADLGCSSGPNSLEVVFNILDTVDFTCRCLNRKPPVFQVFLNDLPGNDFNTIFQSLPSFYERLGKAKGPEFEPCFVAGMPGSFFGRLFPNNSMHIVHSSYSLHWLRQAPKGLAAANKGNIYITNTSPHEVFEAYLNEFEEGFGSFLRCRAKEIAPGCRMVITLIGRIGSTHNSVMEVIGRALNSMVMEGIIKEEKLDNFNVPYYTPSPKEVKKVVEEEGSFSLLKLNKFQSDWDSGFNEEKNNKNTIGQYVSNYMRAVMEPLLAKEFGQSLMDDLFRRVTGKVMESMENGKGVYINLVISLRKIIS